ncbi:MAG TPA: hypothetical protein VN200_05425, partial [Rhodoglobus sp.]|nr:hypothetical protein [Rhodoglobus sp.]
TEAPSETIVRRRPAPEPDAAPEPEPAADEPRRRSVLPWVVGGAAVIVAAGIVLGIVFGGGVGPAAEGTPTASAPPVVLDTVPTPELAAPPTTADAQVTFVLVNPDPQEGDQFVWRPDPAPDEGFRRVDGDTVTVPATGAPVCIQAYVLRDAKTSPNPLRTCST